jgi:hypothetical protein
MHNKSLTAGKEQVFTQNTLESVLKLAHSGLSYEKISFSSTSKLRQFSRSLPTTPCTGQERSSRSRTAARADRECPFWQCINWGHAPQVDPAKRYHAAQWMFSNGTGLSINSSNTALTKKLVLDTRARQLWVIGSCRCAASSLFVPVFSCSCSSWLVTSEGKDESMMRHRAIRTAEDVTKSMMTSFSL